MQPRNLQQVSGFSSEWARIPKNVVRRYVLSIDRVMMQLLLHESVNAFLDEFSRDKLVIFENYPLSKHWRTGWADFSTSVSLFNVLMQN